MLVYTLHAKLAARKSSVTHRIRHVSNLHFGHQVFMRIMELLSVNEAGGDYLHSWNKRTICHQRSAIEGLMHVDDGIRSRSLIDKRYYSPLYRCDLSEISRSIMKLCFRTQSQVCMVCHQKSTHHIAECHQMHHNYVHSSSPSHLDKHLAVHTLRANAVGTLHGHPVHCNN